MNNNNNNFNDDKGQEAHLSHIIIIYRDDTKIFLRYSKAHDTYLLKMNVVNACRLLRK